MHFELHFKYEICNRNKLALKEQDLALLATLAVCLGKSCPSLFHCPSSNFNQMVGTYEELQVYLKEYVEELSRSDERRNAL